MLQDIRFAFRTLVKNPSFTIAAVLCLALGIGVNATMFSVVRALLLRPFPYKDPDALVALGGSNIKRGWHMNVLSYPDFRSWQAANKTLSDMGMYTGSSYNLARDAAADYVQGATISWTMFRTLGVPPQLGRNFREDEDAPNAPRVVLLGDRLWHERFKGDRNVLGKQVNLNGVPHTIVGVMPRDFEFPQAAALWTPLRLDPLANRGNHSWNVFARLKPGVTLDQVRADLAGISEELGKQYPNSNKGWGADVQTMREYLSGNLRPAMLIMMASVAFVLLIACANVANLLLARATARAKEMAVRVALGADGWRVIRQMLTESILVALIGATLGIAFAYAFLRWIMASIPGGVPFWMRFSIDWQVLAFTVAIAVGTGLLFGLVPALQSANPNLNETLRDAGARGASAGRARQRLRSTLVVAEVALSLVLLVGAALLIRSFLSLQSVQPGFDPNNLLTMRVSMTGPHYDSIYKRFNFLDRLLTDLNATPGIVSASITNNIPLGGSNNNQFFEIEGRPAPIGQQPILENRWVSAKYLETLKVPIVRGRMFNQQEWADSGVAGRVVVINQYAAEKLFPGEDPIGKRFTFGFATDTSPRWYTIIGVAANIKHKQLTSDPDYQGYLPYAQGGWSTATIVVRTTGEPTRATPTVLAELRKLDPGLASYRVLSMDASIARSYWQQSLYGKMFGAFAAIALVLAAVGVYGVISYAVSQRTQEIGVRVALGAQRADVLRLIVSHGAMLGGIGIAIGLVGALVVTRFLRTLLIGVSPFDPMSFIVVAGLLAFIALLASYLPALRAARVDPVEALRYD